MASTMYADSPVLSEGLLDVSDGHMIFYQVFGQSAPDAPAAIFLHGGPGDVDTQMCCEYFCKLILFLLDSIAKVVVAIPHAPIDSLIPPFTR